MNGRASGERKRQRIHSLHFLSGYFQCKVYYTLYSVTYFTSRNRTDSYLTREVTVRSLLFCHKNTVNNEKNLIKIMLTLQKW